MPNPLSVPSQVLRLRGARLARNYLQHRLEGSEDRYMALYGHSDWDASNMDLRIRCRFEHKDRLVDCFVTRLQRHLEATEQDTRLLREEADVQGPRLIFSERSKISLGDLLSPRKGVYFDLEEPGSIRVVWNHMQTDGVGMWNALRPLFDPNPPLIPYRDVPPPPPVLPELLALPSVARRMTWRGRLGREAPEGQGLTRGWVRWDVAQVRELRRKIGGPFNIVTSALAVSEVFARHPNRNVLNVGLTGYFPFITGRNKYGVFLCRIHRESPAGIVRQLVSQTRSDLLNWGRSAAQSYALAQLPDRAFLRLVEYYRRQVDVLVSSLPVGKAPITLGDIPSAISCHPWRLTLPYYFLLVGTRHELHVSMTSRFPQSPAFPRLPESSHLQRDPEEGHSRKRRHTGYLRRSAFAMSPYACPRLAARPW